MKEFNLERALAGDPVVTRDGRRVRVICGDLNNDDYKVVVLIENNGREQVQLYEEDGKIRITPHPDDLFMTRITVERWTIVTASGDVSLGLFSTEEGAIATQEEHYPGGRVVKAVIEL